MSWLRLSLLMALTGTAPERVILSGQVQGSSGQHPVYVALWSAEGFLDRPAQQLRLEPDAGVGFRFEVAPGKWALSAFEDLNGNGVLDMGWFGPKEPNGFWRPFAGGHKPSFEEVEMLVAHDTPDANIRLR